MTFLAPDIQEAILMGRMRLRGRLSILLVNVARELSWNKQRAMLALLEQKGAGPQG